MTKTRLQRETYTHKTFCSLRKISEQKTENQKRLRYMHKSIQKIGTKILALVALTMLAACGSVYTKTPVVDTQTGNTNWLYAVSPQTSNTLATVGNTVKALPTEGIPYADVAKDGVLALLGLTSTVLGFVAKVKSSAATQHQQAADLLAATVVKNNLSQQALSVASGTAAVKIVAEHLDNNTV